MALALDTVCSLVPVPVPASSLPVPVSAAVAAAVRQEHRDPIRDLPVRAQSLAQERLAYVAEVYRLARETGQSEQAAAAAVATRAALFPGLAHAGKGGASALHYSNYRNWVAKLGRDAAGAPDAANSAALADRYVRGPRPSHRLAPEFLTLFARFYENENRLSAAEAYRLARRLAPAAGVSDLPTLSQVVYHYRTRVDQTSVLQARMGRDWAAQNLAGYITRDWSAIRPGEMAIGDHHQFDAPCRIWDAERGAWRPVRPWLTAWMDAASWYMAGWIIRAGEHPDSLAIEDALINGIRANGNRPWAILMTDNGKDYTSRGFVEPLVVDGHEHSIAGALGCRHVICLPFNARAKTIERAFGQVAGQFSRYWAGYLGNRPGNRPARAEDLWEHPEDLPTLDQFCEGFAWWLAEVYHAEACAGSAITQGRPPADLWAARPELRPALSDRELYFATLKPLAARKVGRGGRIAALAAEYQSAELWPLIGHQVLVKLDRATTSHVWAFRPDGRLICEALKVQTLPAFDADRERLSAAMAENRRLLSHARALSQERTGERRIVPAVDRLQVAGILPAGALPAHADFADSAESPLQSPGAHAGHGPHPGHAKSSSAESAVSDDALRAEMAQRRNAPQQPSAETSEAFASFLRARGVQDNGDDPQPATDLAERITAFRQKEEESAT